LLSCTNKQDNKNNIETELTTSLDPNTSTLPFDERVKKHIEQRLKISADESYQLKIYREHLNDDNQEDVLITVNRLDYALKRAQEKNQMQKAAVIGFFGDYNYFFIYNSQTNTFSNPIPVTSSPQRELQISFENISSLKHKDVIVDYTIRNSQFRKIYLFLNDLPTYVFQWNLYDGWGTDQTEAYCFEFVESSYTTAVKDILIFRANIENIPPNSDYYTPKPKITCTKEQLKRFFYNPKDRKYYTRDIEHAIKQERQ